MKSAKIYLYFTLYCLFVSLNLNAESMMPEPNWDRSMALQEIRKTDTQAILKPLFQLARTGQNADLLNALSAIGEDPGLATPTKDYLVHLFALGLSDLDANAVSSEVLDFLSVYKANTLVAHEEQPRLAVPMFNTRAAAAGVRNRWDRQQASDLAGGLLTGPPDRWVASYLAASTAGRRGFVDTLDKATNEQLQKLGRSALLLLDSKSELTLVAARAGMETGDMALLRQSIALGSGPGISRALKEASKSLNAKDSSDLLKYAVTLDSETKAALAIAHLAPSRLEDPAVIETLFKSLANRKLSAAAAMVLSTSTDPKIQQRLEASGSSTTQAEDDRIIEWVEDAPVSDADKIALGYPVPVPVDTPLPFDGFRSYNGLLTRHQDIADTSPFSHAFEVGETRYGRTIWAYQMGDADRMTVTGLPEHAMLTNGGIHSREWASHEVATGIIELLALSEGENDILNYLRDNANIVVLPVLNVDGYLQTQSYPSTNWIGTDPDDPDESPRDGRMRRKNMLGADEDLSTEGDHLLGVDLNRNNPPYWNTDPVRSSDQPASLVHHGAFPQSEPETQALATAAVLGPEDKLSMYTDMHTYSQVHFWVRTSNNALTSLTQRLLGTFSNHHVGFDAGKYYWFDDPQNLALNQGIGSTDEYFTHTYQVPAWTIEIEPTFGNHPEWPGQGADYGGLGRNGHDGFILPESEVERVRTELAQSFAVAYYQQAGPPSIAAIRFIDNATGAVVVESEWDVSGETARQRYSFVAQPLQLGREYTFWLAFDKPMRWREDGEIMPLQGQPGSTLDFDAGLLIGEEALNVIPGDGDWLNLPGDAPGGFLNYQDDALEIAFTLPDDETNQGLINGAATVSLLLGTTDMTGSQIDADPSTVSRWQNGGWTGYEDSEGQDGTNTGGIDRTTSIPVTSEVLEDPFVVVPGTSAAWFDPDRDGEGFMLEILSETQALMYWFTYNLEGEQDWYVAQGEIRGNRILFPEMMQVSGGEFGPGFDPDNVVNKVVGSATFIWSGCDLGAMEWRIDNDGNGLRTGRMNLLRLSRIMGLACGDRQPVPPVYPEMMLSGSWYDPSHSGEGYVLEVLVNRDVLVYWFSFDPEGKRRWFFGTGEVQGGNLMFTEMLTTSGGVFGADFNPKDVVVSPWGSLELELLCESGTARFAPKEAGFPAGTLDLTRLTILAGLSCEN